MSTGSSFSLEMNRVNQNKSLFNQMWSFVCSEGLPCLFVILMLCNGLFFAFAIFDETNPQSFNVNSHHGVNEVSTKNNYIN